MKNKTISGILFTVLFAIQAFSLIYVLQSAAVTSIPISIFFDLAALIAFGLAGAKLIGGGSINVAQAGVLSGMYVFLCLLNYNMQLTVVTSALATVSEAMGGSMTAAIVLMIVRVLLLAFALWFAARVDAVPAQPTEETIDAPAQEATTEEAKTEE